MQIANLKIKDGPPNARGFRLLAEFSVDLSDDFRIFDFTLVEAPDGKKLAYAPRYEHGPVAAISPAARDAIAELVVNKLEVLNSANREEPSRVAA